MIALGCLPFLAFCLLAWVIRLRLAGTPSGRGWREAGLTAAVLCAGHVIAGTELLSLWRGIGRAALVGWWSVPVALAAVYLFRHRGEALALGRQRLDWSRWRWVDRALLVSALALLACAWAQAMAAPPNNSDSLCYHLPRQVYWMQQGSVEHYPTGSLRQLVMPPFAEYVGLHLMVLSGGDHLHNLVQWLALLLAMGAVSSIARELGGSLRAELTAAFLLLSMPMAFAQASNTKNDLIVALWLCAGACFALELRAGRFSWWWAGLMGLLFGSLLLTKGTGAILGLPLAAWLGVDLWRRGAKRALGAIALMAVVVTACNAGFWGRNLKAFGTPWVENARVHGGQGVTNELRTFKGVGSIMVRDLASHVSLPSGWLMEKLTAGVLGLHEALGASPQDPRTTYTNRPYSLLSFSEQSDEDLAAAPVHVLLLLTLPLTLLLAWRTAARRAQLLALLGVAAAGFVLFATFLKWQPWVVRLLLPSAALLVPVFALVWTSGALERWGAPAVAAAAALFVAPQLFAGNRPLLTERSIFLNDRDTVRLYSHPSSAGPVKLVVESLVAAAPRVLGFSSPWSTEEYPVQRMLLDQLAEPPRMVGFDPSLGPPRFAPARPDVILSAKTEMRAAQGNWSWAARVVVPPYTLLFPDECPTAQAADAIVVGRLGTSPLGADGPDLVVEMTVREVLKGPAGITRLRLTFPDPARLGERATSPVIWGPGADGVWFLTKDPGSDRYQAATANRLRPLDELRTIRGRLDELRP
jgi:4-amino-4-deoxy-L-arabinose transferase-like glycosyltransferase